MAGVAIEQMGVAAAHHAGFRGEGQMIAICDTGLDRGSLSDLHPSLAHLAVTPISFRPAGRWNDPHGHGTHVIGCALGAGVTPEGPWAGSAPGASLLLQSTFGSQANPFQNRPVLIAPLLRQAHAAGARIHANAWSERSGGGVYSFASREIDTIVAEHPDLLVVVATGNEGRYTGPDGGPEAKTLRSPAPAKNALAVGACKNPRPEYSKPYRVFYDVPGRAGGADLPPGILAEGWSMGPDAVAPFSGRGPTADGRIKPDLVAPGTAVVSARSREGSTVFPTEWGDLPGDPLHALMGCTSVTVPLVAGAAAVVRQALIDRHGVSSPSAALLRAVLVNGAQPLHGALLPNGNQGWGRLNLIESLALAPGTALRVFEETLGPGQVFRRTFVLKDDGIPFRATVAWTDPPGDRLLSDLDLVVRADGETWHGNRSAGDAEFDRVNNLERVRLDAASGSVEVELRAHRIEGASQRFALVAEGALQG